MNQTNGPFYSVLRRHEPKAMVGIFTGVPASHRVLQFARRFRSEDLCRYAIGVVFRETDEEERFLTPRTAEDGMFWTNGLDGVEWLSQTFALFDSPEQAVAAVSRWQWLRAMVFRVSVDTEEGRIYLEEERRVEPGHESLYAVSGGLLQ